MKSENVVFVGGPLDGRVLPVLTGPTGQPPKQYKVPVPGPDGETLLVYNREPKRRRGSRLGMARGWRYVHDPEGRVQRRRWPWRRPERA
ncbi:hypothetical protein [Streptomyces sp. SPB074]|uniref:hypothetical protein n=1 Tax=Streptomyces sp. (strain SPB074) TaxID=465543 RepID=UPI0001D1E32A|nr:hypothetical protein [Streptomyces sp. SPB074]EFG64660.1 conserved hypothetical protein [Streptomyces sp. SPB074]